MIIITGTIDFEDSASRDAALEASIPLQMATRDDEPGCLAYVFAADPGVENRMIVWENWTDAPSLDAHFEHPNYHNMRPVLGGFGAITTDIYKYRTDAHDRVYSPEGKASATFWSVE